MVCDVENTSDAIHCADEAGFIRYMWPDPCHVSSFMFHHVSVKKSCPFSLFRWFLLVVNTGACDCLERLVPEMIYYMSRGTLNSTHSLA